jgi:hypothetical protein
MHPPQVQTRQRPPGAHPSAARMGDADSAPGPSFILGRAGIEPATR